MVPDIAKKGRSFKGAFQYYLHDKNADTSERVGWTETRNLMTDDPDAARNIMIATALQADELKKAAGIKAAGRKSTQHVYAYSLAWHPDEAGNLDKDEMLSAVDASLKELEAEHLQSVLVCHTDQKHPHVHVIINRVDPSDGRMHGFKNDRLKLSDWANRYERERGNIVTPAREEKRQERKKHQDKKSRQDYARSKRDEAGARSKADLSPAAMLKDLGEAQKLRHRQEWRDLSAANKSKRNKIYDDHRQRIKDAVALHRLETKPFWAKHFQEQRDRKKAFDGRETNIIGVVQNAMSATAYQHMRGELDGRGQLSATFSNVLSSQKRRAAFDDRLDMDKAELRTHLKEILDTEITDIKAQRAAALAEQRLSFLDDREGLIQRQDSEWDKIREAWSQLRTRKSFAQSGRKPVKREFDKNRQPSPKPAKAAPTRSQPVSTPAPAPSPSGEVPRSTAKATSVPKKDWSQTTVKKPAKGISGTEPAKKDWGKTGASKTATAQPKDWSKKVDKKPQPVKSPTRNFDRDR